MRIIGGIHRGRVLRVPQGLPVRPTTDFAKEALFNILANRIDLEGAAALDLFSGTGNISLELASRGAVVTAVDSNFKCVSYIRETASKLGLAVSTVKSDVFGFLASATGKYDFVFADPPYDLEEIPRIHALVCERGLVSKGGMEIIEHGPRTDLSQLAGFESTRKYGNVSFSFFAH